MVSIDAHYYTSTFGKRVMQPSMDRSGPSYRRIRSPSPSDRNVKPVKTLKGKDRDDGRPLRDVFGYQEIFLRVLSFLSPTDLASVQGVNQHWSRMTLDPQLWRRLYLSRYPHPHSSRLIYRDEPPGSTSTPMARRRISRLPSRAFPPPSPSRTPSRSSANGEDSGSVTPMANGGEDEVGWGVRNDGVDWKMMLRLETNWANGNASSERTYSLPPSPSPTISSDRPAGETQPRNPPTQSQQHIALSPSFIFTSDPASPLVQVHRASAQVGVPDLAGQTSVPLGIVPPPPGWSSPHRPDNITCICTDQSVSLPETDTVALPSQGKPSIPTRLAVFYQSGGFVILHIRLDGSRLLWKRESIHPPASRPRSIRRRNVYIRDSTDPVVLAVLHHPVLITCSLSFHVSAYSVSPSTTDEPSRPLHLSTMHSDVSFHPAVLSLFPDDHDPDTMAQYSDRRRTNIEGPRHFRASLTYCTPLYPSSWTVAVQDFTLDLRSDLSDGTARRDECYTVVPSEENAMDELTWPRQIKPVIGVKGRRAVGVGSDGRWCVLAGNDNQIQVYAIPEPQSTDLDFLASPGKQLSRSIVHSQTLLSHSSAVTSLALLSGRCVSGGRDGRVLVWELDDDHNVNSDGRRGRTVGYVEVRPAGRRKWLGASGPPPPPLFGSSESKPPEALQLPHPASISTAARSLFLPRPPDEMRPRNDRPPPIRQLAFDEEKIVGIVRANEDGQGARRDQMMKVWCFNS